MCDIDDQKLKKQNKTNQKQVFANKISQVVYLNRNVQY